MGEVWVDVRISASGAPGAASSASVRIALPEHTEASKTVKMLADTGATLSVLPRPLLVELGIRPKKRIQVVESDGRVVERDAGEAVFGVNGDSLTSRVIFGDPGDAVVLGLIVLEAMGLAVDPVQRQLIPSPMRK